ncbi:16S rRNA methyltransferase [Effusibacillus lacus]|uniref:16S rRNA methyltransferase n=1 Tax=Effusibacillus lacus TaxID=1348429 RepID=A0A292YLJ0_9BACL|nr:16S rRNA (guanine1207-N2)-methyltransferase [Effusibacillus lacus]GAX89330.1 16S rRNA methyltransferase [Effusibacillus lacus]
MVEHYFSNYPTVARDLRLVRDRLRQFDLEFWTDAGVFSKGGVDFGSRLLIETMDIPNGARVLDVGCGYGPIGITAAKLAPDGHVLMIDVNGRAVELARKNAGQNGVKNVEVRQSDLFFNVHERSFDRILTNPPIRAGKAVVHEIFEEAAMRVNQSGELWVVIQKKQGAPSAKKKLEELFEEVDDVAKDAGYRIFRCRKSKSEVKT